MKIHSTSEVNVLEQLALRMPEMCMLASLSFNYVALICASAKAVLAFIPLR